MEQTNLNQKSWYRGLKVFFILSFLLAQGLGFLITYNVTSEKVSFVKCDNGKELEDSYSFPSDTEKLQIYKKCDLTAFLLNYSDVKGVLTDAQRKELGAQVSQMQNNGTLQSEMQSAVDDFIQKYADTTPGKNIGPKLTKEEFVKKFNHDINDSFSVAGKDYSWVANFTFQYKDKYPIATKLIYYILSFFIVSAIFWLISRTFFYIFAKEKFLPFKLHR